MKNMSLNLHTNSYEKYESQSIHTQILIRYKIWVLIFTQIGRENISLRSVIPLPSQIKRILARYLGTEYYIYRKINVPYVPVEDSKFKNKGLFRIFCKKTGLFPNVDVFIVKIYKSEFLRNAKKSLPFRKGQ